MAKINIQPTTPCKKCRNDFWVEDIIPLTWVCPICGNNLYFRYGVFSQQIEMIMRSARKAEYVKSPDGKSLEARVNLEIKKIRYNRERDKKKGKQCII